MLGLPKTNFQVLPPQQSIITEWADILNPKLRHSPPIGVTLIWKIGRQFGVLVQTGQWLTLVDEGKSHPFLFHPQGHWRETFQDMPRIAGQRKLTEMDIHHPPTRFLSLSCIPGLAMKNTQGSFTCFGRASSPISPTWRSFPIFIPRILVSASPGMQSSMAISADPNSGCGLTHSPRRDRKTMAQVTGMTL